MAAKRKQKRDEPPEDGPLRVPIAFDEAIRRALQVKPPEDGWKKEAEREKARRKKGSRKPK